MIMSVKLCLSFDLFKCDFKCSLISMKMCIVGMVVKTLLVPAKKCYVMCGRNIIKDINLSTE